MAIGLKLIAGTLPTNCYPATPQELYAAMFALGQAEASELDGVIISDTTPAATDRDKAWLKTSAGAPLWPPIYRYFNGQWVMRHNVDPSGSERRIWVGALADLNTYEGGSAGAVGDASGPFWEEDAAFQDRIPMGVGPAIALAVATNYGIANAQVTLAPDNIKDHRHFTAADFSAAGQPKPTASNQTAHSGGGTGNENYIFQGTSTEANIARSSPADGLTGANSAFSVLNPVRGIYVIKRTARIYWVA